MKDRLFALDGLRGVAALVVFGYHIGRAVGLPIFPRGYLAVDFFFVLSGFVLARAYDDRLATRRLRPLMFLVKRYQRLWPTAFAGTTLGVLVAVASSTWPQPHGVAIAVLNAFMVPNLFVVPAAMYPFNPPHWSLWYELIVNYVYGLLLAPLAAQTMLILVVACAAVVVWQAKAAGSVDAAGFARAGYSFFAGVVLWRVIGREQAPLSLRHSWLALTALVAAIAGASCLPTANSFGLEIELAAAFVLFPAVVVLGARIRLGGPVASVCSVAGATSYPIYALHYPIVTLFATHWLQSH